ncbi:MAG TPA: fructose-6-phosphate aldolase [Candidatus Dorea intestinavium]|nr:fructose-6-phosphate aldolase [Candidatus Dorea intestinavium]
MKVFIDTADIKEITELNEWGIIDGVTTNPTLIAKTGFSQDTIIKTIAEIVQGPISAEVISQDAEGMINEAYILRQLGQQIVIKIPCTVEGLKAVKVLSKENIPVNVTLVFSLTQALLAVKAGASYVSPFIGRLEDIGENGVKLVCDMQQLFDNYGFSTQIIAASIRNLDHVKQMLLAGVAIATIPSSIIRQMIGHELTNKGLAQFLQDYYDSIHK